VLSLYFCLRSKTLQLIVALLKAKWFTISPIDKSSMDCDIDVTRSRSYCDIGVCDIFCLRSKTQQLIVALLKAKWFTMSPIDKSSMDCDIGACNI